MPLVNYVCMFHDSPPPPKKKKWIALGLTGMFHKKQLC